MTAKGALLKVFVLVSFCSSCMLDCTTADSVYTYTHFIALVK